MIMLTNLAIHTMLVPLQTAVPHLTKFLMKSCRVIYKRRKIEKFQRKGRTKTAIKQKDETIIERTAI